jgi:hypothetical protein
MGSEPESLERLRREMDADCRLRLDRLRDELGRELMRKEFRIAELELGGAQPMVAIDARTAAEYESTLSWRVTKPLRALGNLIRRP